MKRDQQHTSTSDASRSVDMSPKAPESAGIQAGSQGDRADEAPSEATNPRSDTSTRAKGKKLRLVRRDTPDKAVRLTRRGYDLIQQAAADGVSKQTIAHRLGVAVKTFRDLLARDEQAQESFDLGNAANETELRDLLMEKARAGNVTAAIYLTKARHGWTEGEAPDLRPNVIINLPGALSPDQYLKTIRQGAIDHESDS
ncbi:MAG: hypothetical protein WD795_17060 [Woeseia sp.]